MNESQVNDITPRFFTDNFQVVQIEDVPSVPDITKSILKQLTRTELGFIAKVLKIPVGKSRVNTIENLHGPIFQGQAHIKVKITISKPPEPGQNHAGAFFMKTLNSYEGNSTIVDPYIKIHCRKRGNAKKHTP